MIDWGIVAKVAGGGYGVTILVLIILAVISWVVGKIIQRTTKETKENSNKG